MVYNSCQLMSRIKDLPSHFPEAAAEIFRPPFPVTGFIGMVHTCVSGQVETVYVPYNNNHFPSIEELACSIIQRLNQDETLVCHGCGSPLEPYFVTPAPYDEVATAIDAWLDRGKIPNR